MLGFSQSFQDGTSRVTKAWINLTLTDGTSLEYHEDRVMMNGIIRDSSTSVDGQFTVGAAVTGKMTVILNNSDEELSAYDFRGATMVVWLGGESPVLKAGLHPDADVTEGTQFTITGLTAEQLELFTVNTQLDFGVTDGDHDYGRTYITAVSTSDDVTSITVHDAITITTNTFISISQAEKVNVGRYYVDEYTYDGSNVTLVGYDDMVKFDVPCKDIPWSSSYNTPYALIDYMCYKAGVALYPSDWNFIYHRSYYALASRSDFSSKQVLFPQQPPQWDTLTAHDVIAACAQIVGLYAHIVYVPNPGAYYLKFDWYDTSQLTSNQYDGGTFDTDTTPYSDGATLDGGDFSYTDADSADGGAFGDRTGVHIVPSPYDLTVDTDDVMITGITVNLDPSDNINAEDNTSIYTTTLGDDGYKLVIAGNPLITTTENADKMCQILHYYNTGMRFRPLSASVANNPSMEAGDVAIVTGRNENTYSCFLSRVTYSVNAATQISCDAESTMQNLKGRFSGAQKIQAMVQKVAAERATSNAETAMVGILTAYASSRGLYQHVQTTSSGTIYTYGNAPTLAASDIQWRFSAGSIMVSTDYGQTWNSALSADGTAVMQSLYAVGINADYIEAGDLTLGGITKNVDGNFYLKDAQGNLRVTMNKYGIFNGKTSINDTTHTGFYLSNDGLIVGDSTNDRYIRLTPDGKVYVHDNLYPNSSGDEIGEGEPSFMVEGVNDNDNPGRLILSSSGIDLEETVNDVDRTIVSISAEGHISAIGEISNNVGLVVASSGSGTDGIVKRLVLKDSSGIYVYLGIQDTDGNTVGIDITRSDSRWKKNIEDSNVNALDTINKIRHRQFDWKRSGAHTDNGYIAQELRKVLPDAILAVKQDDGSEHLQIRNGEIIPYLTKAIQELSAKVDALEARLAEMEA